MKTLLRSFALLALTLCSTANGSIIGFTHNQTTLGEELLATIHCDVYPCSVTTREFEVFNLTGVQWSDYHLRIESNVPAFHLNEESDGISPIFDDIFLLDGVLDMDKFTTVDFLGSSADFFNGSISLGASFKFASRVTEPGGTQFIDAIETYQIFGTPSVVPLPSSLALLGLGLVLLIRKEINKLAQ